MPDRDAVRDAEKSAARDKRNLLSRPTPLKLKGQMRHLRLSWHAGCPHASNDNYIIGNHPVVSYRRLFDIEDLRFASKLSTLERLSGELKQAALWRQ
jgi:hypothetical protein